MMHKVVKWYFIIWALLAVWRLMSWLWEAGRTVVLGSALVLLVIAAIVSALFLKEQWRRKREGYFVDSLGGPEDGSVIYDEGGKRLELYFYRYDREKYSPVIYVPSERKWREVMPVWAKTRRDEIMSRIKKHIRWRYEENDNYGFSYHHSHD